MPERASRPIRVYVLSILVVVAVASAVGGVFVGARTTSDAREEGAARTGVAARLARIELQRALAMARSEVEAAATRADVIEVARTRDDACQLERRKPGALAIGHLSVIDPSGEIVCSSLPATLLPISTYRFQIWLSMARRSDEAVVSDPFTDPFTRDRSIAVVAALRTTERIVGFLAHVFPLTDVAYQLLENVASEPGTAIVILRVDANEIMTAAGVGEIDPSALPPDTPSASGRAWPDRITRIWAAADMPDHGWRVYSGIVEEVVLTDSRATTRRVSLVLLASCLAGLLAALAIARGIAQPLRDVRTSIEEALDGDVPEPRPLAGPTEVRRVVALLDEFLRRRAAREDQLMRLAFVDERTGLGNRERMLDRLSADLTGAHPGSGIALVVVGLDPQDPLDPEAADDAIAEVATRLAVAVPPRVSLYRIGAFELGLLLFPITSDADAIALCEIVTRDEASLETVRAGSATIDDGSIAPAELVRRATTALDDARREGVRYRQHGVVKGSEPRSA